MSEMASLQERVIRLEEKVMTLMLLADRCPGNHSSLVSAAVRREFQDSTPGDDNDYPHR